MKNLARLSIGLLSVISTICNLAIAHKLQPESVGDFGNSIPSYPAENAIDGTISSDSRWVATFEGGAANLWVDLGSIKIVDKIGIAWDVVGTRSYKFEVRVRNGLKGDWDVIYKGHSSGETTDIELYEFNNHEARQVRVKVFSNSDGAAWVGITEFEVHESATKSLLKQNPRVNVHSDEGASSSDKSRSRSEINSANLNCDKNSWGSLELNS